MCSKARAGQQCGQLLATNPLDVGAFEQGERSPALDDEEELPAGQVSRGEHLLEARQRLRLPASPEERPGGEELSARQLALRADPLQSFAGAGQLHQPLLHLPHLGLHQAQRGPIPSKLVLRALLLRPLHRLLDGHLRQRVVTSTAVCKPQCLPTVGGEEAVAQIVGDGQPLLADFHRLFERPQVAAQLAQAHQRKGLVAAVAGAAGQLQCLLE